MTLTVMRTAVTLTADLVNQTVTSSYYLDLGMAYLDFVTYGAGMKAFDCYETWSSATDLQAADYWGKS